MKRKRWKTSLLITASLIAVIVMAAIIVWLCIRADQKVKADYALSGRK